MSTNHTTNYDLNQWEGTDRVLRTEFNADNAKIDAALKANADAVAALEATISQKGNCTVLHSTYTGDGWYGEDHPSGISGLERARAILHEGATAYQQAMELAQSLIQNAEALLIAPAK